MLAEIPGILSHKGCIEAVERLTKTRSGKIKIKGLPGTSQRGQVEFIRNQFLLKFDHHVSASTFKIVSTGRTLKRIEFVHRTDEISLDSVFLGKYSPPEFTGYIPAFYSKGFSKKRKYFYKLIIPLSKKLDFFFQVEQAIFKNDMGIHSRSATKVAIAGIGMVACALDLKDRGKQYLIIESTEALNFESFSDRAHALKNALGYLTGFLPGKLAYYFGLKSSESTAPEHYFFSEIRDEIRSGYPPVYCNPNGWIRDAKVAEVYFKKRLLRVLNVKELTTLCQRIYENIEFTSVLLLILESSVASLLFMPGGFAIALEMLSDIVVQEKQGKQNPVKDKVTSDSIRSGCFDVIEKHKSLITTEALQILRNKINGLNQVTNKARLKAPFEVLRIRLLARDLEILETRNDFLHGRVPDLTKLGVDRPVDRVNRDLYYASMRLLTLMNMVILKWIGYDNRVLNHAKLQERFCRIRLREKHYRKV